MLNAAATGRQDVTFLRLVPACAEELGSWPVLVVGARVCSLAQQSTRAKWSSGPIAAAIIARQPQSVGSVERRHPAGTSPPRHEPPEACALTLHSPTQPPAQLGWCAAASDLFVPNDRPRS